MDENFAAINKFELEPSPSTYSVSVADGTLSGIISTRTKPLELHLGSHREQLQFLIVPRLKSNVTLGLPWIRAHNPSVNWRTLSFTFDDPVCYEQSHITTPTVIQALSPSQAKALGNPQALSNPQEEALCSRESQAGRNVHTVKAASISYSENAPSHCVEDKFELQDWDDFHRLNNEEGITTIYATLIDFTSHARGPCDVLPASGLGSNLTHQMDSVLSTKLYDESHIPTDGRGVPNLYADFSDIFRDKSTDRVPLPPHRPHDPV